MRGAGPTPSGESRPGASGDQDPELARAISFKFKLFLVRANLKSSPQAQAQAAVRALSESAAAFRVRLIQEADSERAGCRRKLIFRVHHNF